MAFASLSRWLSNGSVAALEPGLRSTRVHGAPPSRHDPAAPLHVDAMNPVAPSAPSTWRDPEGRRRRPDGSTRLSTIELLASHSPRAGALPSSARAAVATGVTAAISAA